MNQFKVSYKRHLAKTISYRILSTTIGFLAMWWATGSVKLGAAFGVAELVYKPIQYYIHERIWYKFIKFGLVSNQKKNQKKDTTKLIQKEPISETKKSVPTPSEKKKGKRLSYTKQK